MALTVVGIFDDASDAQQAVDALVNKGFSRSNIDLSAGRSSETYSTTGDTGTGTYATTSGTSTDDSKSSGIGGFFSSLFGSDDDDNTKKYSAVGDQGSIVTVHAQTEDEADRAADILDDNGAVDVDDRAAEYGYAATTGTATGLVDTSTVVPTPTTDADQSIKVIEENLEVGKRTVETGGVRLRSRIVSRPVEESVRLREERVTVKRTPVNRPVSTTDLNAFQEGEITMTEHAEVPVVSKTANVVEEISVGKEVSERDQVISDTVRKTEVDVENLSSTNTPTSTGSNTDGSVTYSK